MPLLADASFGAMARPPDFTRRSTWAVRAGIVAAAVLLYFWGAGERGLWSFHEGRTAQNALNILEGGDWLIPRLHTGEAETQKPPLYFWMSAASAALWGGVDGWSIRFPSLIASVVGLLIVFEFGRAVGGLGLGAAAATILGCTSRYAWLAQVGRVDMTLAIAVLGCLFLFWNSRVRDFASKRESPLPYSFYLWTAVAVMLKGPVALMFIGLPILTWLILAGRPLIPGLQPGAWREWRALRILPGMVVASVLGGAWFFYADHRLEGAVVRNFFLYHHLGRLFASDAALNANPSWTYIPRFAADFFPWSLLLPFAVHHFWRLRQSLLETPNGATAAFLAAWLIGPFVFLSAVAYKRADYLLPIYPAAALLIGCWLDDRRRRFHQRRDATVAFDYRSRSQWIVASAFVLAGVVAALVFWGERQYIRKGGLAKTMLNSHVLDPHLNATDEFVLLRIESILREHWPLLGILLPALAASVWLMYTGWHERLNRRFTAGFAVPWAVCFVLQSQVVTPRLDALRDMERFAQTIRHLAGAERTIYYFDEIDADLVFHAGKPAKHAATWEELVEMGRRPTPVFVVLRAEKWSGRAYDPALSVWKKIANNSQFARHREPRVLITNHADDVADRLRTAPAIFLR